MFLKMKKNKNEVLQGEKEPRLVESKYFCQDTTIGDQKQQLEGKNQEQDNNNMETSLDKMTSQYQKQKLKEKQTTKISKKVKYRGFSCDNNKKSLQKQNSQFHLSDPFSNQNSFSVDLACSFCSSIFSIDNQEHFLSSIQRLKEYVWDLKFQIITLKEYFKDYIIFQQKQMTEMVRKSTKDLISACYDMMEQKNQQLLNSVVQYKKLFEEQQSLRIDFQKKYRTILYEKNKLEMKNRKYLQKKTSIQEQLAPKQQYTRGQKLVIQPNEFLKSSQEKPLELAKYDKSRNKTLNEIELMKGKLSTLKDLLNSNNSSPTLKHRKKA